MFTSLSADPDPIWICESLTACPHNSDGSANITSTVASPAQGKVGKFDTLSSLFSLHTKVYKLYIGNNHGLKLIRRLGARFSLEIDYNIEVNPGTSKLSFHCSHWPFRHLS